MTTPQPQLHVFGGGKDVDESRVLERAGSETWQRSVRIQARNYKKLIDTHYMMLARLLWEIFDTPAEDFNGPPIYTKWGHKTFTHYVEEELGLPGRKGEALKAIWYKLAIENGGLELSKELEDRLIRLGWTKVRELASILTPKNVEEWISKAEQSNYPTVRLEVLKVREELQAAANRARDLGEDPKEAKQNVKDQVLPTTSRAMYKSFTFYDDQWDNVSLAMDKAKRIASARTDKRNDGYLLDLICTEFLATNNFGEENTTAKVAMLHKMSHLMGLKLAIIDPTAPVGEKIVYGLQHLEELEKQSDASQKANNVDDSDNE